MAKQTIKKITTNIALYGGLAALGAFSGQQLGTAITGHSFFAHASGQVDTAAVDATAAAPQQQPEGTGPCNCALCCHVVPS
jgi:uncharacterized membrane protein YebE (DUF533 family)